jgi:hypothetical protein
MGAMMHGSSILENMGLSGGINKHHQLRTANVRLFESMNVSASDRRNLMELDVEIMELEAQIKKLGGELQAVTGPADSATLPSLWGDTPYTSWKTLD